MSQLDSSGPSFSRGHQSSAPQVTAEAAAAGSPLMTVVELGGGYAAAFAGLLLAGCGAEVIRFAVEDAAPRQAPRELTDPDWIRDYLNGGKLTIRADLRSAAGKRRLVDCWRRADAVIVDEAWLDFEPLEDLLTTPGPGVVAVISPFGLSGPYAAERASAGTIFAMAGESSMLPGGLGYALFPDAPPLIAAGHLAEADAGAIAATVCLAGALEADVPQTPLLFDISVLECETSLNRWLVSHYDSTGWVESRATRAYAYAGLVRCRDGYVMMQPTTDAHWAGLVSAMEHPAWAAQPHWATQDGRTEDGAEISANIADWAASKTKAELLDIGLAHEVPIAPFLEIPEVVDCEQFEFRGFYRPYAQDGSPSAVRKVPGVPFTLFTAGRRSDMPDDDDKSSQSDPETSSRGEDSDPAEGLAPTGPITP
jgi:crotonobetainyl-CoA:carnitine CoA-transferase CaiB-like acyl-CoA transferase